MRKPTAGKNHTCAFCVKEPLHQGLVCITMQKHTLVKNHRTLVNCSVNDLQWLQATLPIRDGGLGIHRVVSLPSSAYLASAASTLGLHTVSYPVESGSAPGRLRSG